MPRKKKYSGQNKTNNNKLLFDGFVERSSTSAAGLVSDEEGATGQQQEQQTSGEEPPVDDGDSAVEKPQPTASTQQNEVSFGEVGENDDIDDDTMIKLIESRQHTSSSVEPSREALSTVEGSVERLPRRQQSAEESSEYEDADRAIKIIHARQNQQPIPSTRLPLDSSPADTAIESVERQPNTMDSSTISAESSPRQKQTPSLSTLRRSPLTGTATESVEHRSGQQQRPGRSKVDHDNVCDDSSVVEVAQSQQQQASPHNTIPTTNVAPRHPGSTSATGPQHGIPPVKQRLQNTAETILGPGAVARRTSSQTLLDDDSALLDASKVSLSENASSTRNLIAAELVLSEIDASQRRRIVEEARQEFLQEVTPAHVVEFVHQPPARESLQQIEEADAVKRGGPVNWTRRMMVVAASLLLACILLVVILSSTLRRRPANGKAQFSSTEELHDAINAYMVAVSTTSKPEASTVARRYGWPIGSWDVSQITDFSSCFDLNRGLEALEFADEEVAGNFFDADLSDWDVSNAATMRGMFAGTARFSADLSRWNVSKVVDFSFMFHSSSFNGDISEWDTSSAVDMTAMFGLNSVFNQPLYWNVSQVEFLDFMFFRAFDFEGDGLDEWDVSRVVSMESAFDGADLGQAELSNWDVSSVVDMRHAFSDTCCFVGNAISSWNVSNGMFAGAESFEGDDLTAWDVSRVTDMSSIFAVTLFVGDVSTWNTSSVTDLNHAFYDSEFSGDVSGWDTANVKDMAAVFELSLFDGDLSDWNTSSVEYMDFMFAGNCDFTGQGLENWDTSNVMTMDSMFEFTCAFDADISNWDVSNVETFDHMFDDAVAFTQDLCAWGPLIQGSANVTNMFLDSGCPQPTDPSGPDGPFCTVCVEN